MNIDRSSEGEAGGNEEYKYARFAVSNRKSIKQRSKLVNDGDANSRLPDCSRN
jgi:hypothetical protein